MKKIKRNDLKGPRFSIRYWRIFVTLGSGIAGFNCTLKWSLSELGNRRLYNFHLCPQIFVTVSGAFFKELYALCHRIVEIARIFHEVQWHATMAFKISAIFLLIGGSDF